MTIYQYAEALDLATNGTLNGSVLTPEGWVAGSGRESGVPPEYVGFWPGITIDSAGIVPDVSGKGNPLLYTKNMVDAVAKANSGYFSTAVGAQGSPQGLEIPLASFSPDIANGDSAFMSWVINFATQPSALAAVAGNAGNVQVPGVAVYTNANGTLSVYLVGSDQGATSAGTTPTVTGSNVDHRLTIYLDGRMKRGFAWWDGVLFMNSHNLSVYGNLRQADAPWWFGGGGLTGRDRATQASRNRDAHFYWFKQGVMPDPVKVDRLLRVDGRRVISKDELGVS